ncbi:hypothetical protein FJ651_12505 [Paucihalobacter ruber]|uniref:Collagen-like protein n=1 Tax=Paucihalobacter ruber TaxID=2567861 RepID=A0A506PFK0_9FLAO|nr:hypothetical protein [Paucihalobacter ruber]TPV32379.1 hypothetical protein FJ651_12505 [Paucihalobacter ruber]
MKKLFTLFTAVVLIGLSSCEGPQGPPGPPGLNGADGQDGEVGIIVSQAFEIVLDFNEQNNYEFIEPYGFEVFPTDVTLVFILWEDIAGTEVWRLLPQSVEFSDGNLVYNYDFTQEDVRFFLDGTTNFAALGNEWTQAQVFRVVVVPADNLGRQNLTDFDAIMALYGITEFEKRQGNR